MDKRESRMVARSACPLITFTQIEILVVHEGKPDGQKIPCFRARTKKNKEIDTEKESYAQWPTTCGAQAALS